jgi:myo-inositol 2-dehydrogenase/D-chiro-inositol 1-dehydrogenase
MGARHANHFLHRTPRAELVAAFTPDPKELAWAQANLEPWGVKIYSDYDEMLNHKGLEAVCVATATTVHAEQTIKAIEAGKHVLCEKPLSTELSIVCLSQPSISWALPANPTSSPRKCYK